MDKQHHEPAGILLSEDKSRINSTERANPKGEETSQGLSISAEEHMAADPRTGDISVAIRTPDALALFHLHAYRNNIQKGRIGMVEISQGIGNVRASQPTIMNDNDAVTAVEHGNGSANNTTPSENIIPKAKKASRVPKPKDPSQPAKPGHATFMFDPYIRDMFREMDEEFEQQGNLESGNLQTSSLLGKNSSIGVLSNTGLSEKPSKSARDTSSTNVLALASCPTINSNPAAYGSSRNKKIQGTSKDDEESHELEDRQRQDSFQSKGAKINEKGNAQLLVTFRGRDNESGQDSHRNDLGPTGISGRLENDAPSRSQNLGTGGVSSRFTSSDQDSSSFSLVSLSGSKYTSIYETTTSLRSLSGMSFGIRKPSSASNMASPQELAGSIVIIFIGEGTRGLPLDHELQPQSIIVFELDLIRWSQTFKAILQNGGGENELVHQRWYAKTNSTDISTPTAHYKAIFINEVLEYCVSQSSGSGQARRLRNMDSDDLCTAIRACFDYESGRTLSVANKGQHKRALTVGLWLQATDGFMDALKEIESDLEPVAVELKLGLLCLET